MQRTATYGEIPFVCLSRCSLHFLFQFYHHHFPPSKKTKYLLFMVWFFFFFFFLLFAVDMHLALIVQVPVSWQQESLPLLVHSGSTAPCM
jgi:hypothetical protein